MKPLHDAYARGRLHVGMIALYADATGPHPGVSSHANGAVVNPVDSELGPANAGRPEHDPADLCRPTGTAAASTFGLVAVD